MNLAVVQRIAKYCIVPLRNANILIRKSSFRRQDFASFLRGRQTQKCIIENLERNKRILSPSALRCFSTSIPRGGLSIYDYSIATVATLGVVGGFLYHSLQLKKSNLYEQAMDLLSTSAVAKEILQCEIENVALIRGNTHEENGRLTFIVNGKDGKYVVAVEGKLSEDGSYRIHNLCIHRRAKVPIVEVYIIRNGEIVTSVSDTKAKDLLNGESPTTA